MIKQIRKIHIKQVVEYEKEFIDNEHYTSQTLLKMLDNETYFFIGFFNKNTLVGYLIANISQSSIDLFKIFTACDYRRKNIARKLLKHLIKKHHNKPIYLEVCHTNTVAINVYTKLGFNEIHTRLNYYGQNKHAIIMVL
jgi:ribosomal-protein-alanine N-acetyltransferase